MSIWKNKLCILLRDYDFISIDDHMGVLKNAGFDGFFSSYENVDEYGRLAKKHGMIYQSIHGSYRHARDIWYDEGEKGELGVTDLVKSLEDAHRNNVTIVITHAFVGFEDHTTTDMGLERYARVMKKAEELEVTMAFENTEGEEFLAAVMTEFKSSPSLGFCWDTGHEMCYNHSKDMLALYGDKLVGTHISDNLGISDFEGRIVPSDDLHLLPFDGIADWDYNMARLDKCGFEGALTFELDRRRKHNRHETDAYFDMSFEAYIASCYMRACRVASKRRLSTKHI